MNVETKQVSFLEAKMADEGNGSLTGYASVKNNVDSYGDVILDGAYKNLDTLTKLGWSGFNHSSKPVGMVTVAREDAKGLYVEIEFHSTAEAQEVRKIAKERMEKGLDLGMSIMFKTMDSSWGERDGDEVRELKAIEVVEAGFVMMPANTAATVTGVKSGSGTRLDDQVKAARELCDDLAKRLSDLTDERKNGLSDERKAEARDIRDKWISVCELIDAKSDDPEVEDEVVLSLVPGW